MGEMAESTEIWVKGFLTGCEPDPPIDQDGQTDFSNPTYKVWEQTVELFRHTGYWHTDEIRHCVGCNNPLLRSESEEKCSKCRH